MSCRIGRLILGAVVAPVVIAAWVVAVVASSQPPHVDPAKKSASIACEAIARSGVDQCAVAAPEIIVTMDAESHEAAAICVGTVRLINARTHALRDDGWVMRIVSPFDASSPLAECPFAER